VPDTVDLTFTQTKNVQANMSRAGRMVYEGSVSEAFSGIRPAETAEIAYLVKPDTASLNVVVRGIIPALPPAQQNQFFGDDVFLRIQGSVVHARDRKVSTFITSDQTYSFPRPEAGVWRITPSGDWTNAGTIGFTVDVWTTEDPLGAHTRKARISHGDTHTYEIHVPAGTARLDTTLEWRLMNGHYPINDVDVLLYAPGATTPNTACATARTPEVCAITNPAGGTWRVVVQGFNVFTENVPQGRETYTLRMLADGTLLR
jgi:hypothetical protein